MALQRTAKSCGSDAPKLASSLREEAQATVSNKPGHRGEREVSRKTIARGMPGRSGVTVVTTLVCFFHCTRGCGCIGHPATLRPLISEDRTFLSKTRAKRAARLRSRVWKRHCRDTVDNSRNTATDIQSNDRYINPARHVRAFGVGIGIANDGIDTIERRPRRAPQTAVVSLLASRHPRDGSRSRPFCGRRDRKPPR